MNNIFVDTSGWIALVNRSDSLHAAASQVYNERFNQGWSFVTHAGVLLEVGNGLSTARLRHLAVQLKARLVASARVEIEPLSDDLYEAGWNYMKTALTKIGESWTASALC